MPRRPLPVSRLFFFLVLAAAVTAPGTSAVAGDGAECSLPPAVDSALTEILDVEPSCLQSRDCRHEVVEAVEALLARSSESLALHRRYQDFMLSLAESTPEQTEAAARARLVERYEDLARQRPDDPTLWYLAGRVATDETQRAHFQRALELDPGHPWAHLGMAWLTAKRAEAATDVDRARALDEEAGGHLLRFWQGCPDRVDTVLRYREAVAHAESWRSLLPGLWEGARQLPSRLRVNAYPILWEIAFRVEPPSDHEAVRQSIRQDLDDLEAIAFGPDHDPEVSEDAWGALRWGYESLGDRQGLATLNERLQKQDPCSPRAVQMQIQELGRQVSEQIGQPLTPDTAFSSDTARSLYETALRRGEECPKAAPYDELRFSAAVHIDDMPPQDFLAEVDRHLGLHEERGTGANQFPTPWGRAARALLERQLRLEQVPDLIARQREIVERRMAEQIERSPTAPAKAVARQGRLDARMDDLALVAEAQLLLGRDEALGQTLGQYEAALSELRALETTDAEHFQERFAPTLEGRLWSLRGQRAEARGEPLDALAYYQRSLALHPGDGEVAGRAEALWDRLGGTPTGWSTFSSHVVVDGVSSAPTESGWLVKNEPLDFELVDLAGRTWRPEDLEGRTVLLNVWATWCGPCRQEMPAIVELHREIEGRDDLLILSLNMDRNRGVVAPFAEEHGLEMPVLLAVEYLRERQVFSIPQNWIVDAEGVLRFQQVGYDPDPGESFAHRLLSKMEDVHRQTTPGGHP